MQEVFRVGVGGGLKYLAFRQVREICIAFNQSLCLLRNPIVLIARQPAVKVADRNISIRSVAKGGGGDLRRICFIDCACAQSVTILACYRFILRYVCHSLPISLRALPRANFIWTKPAKWKVFNHLSTRRNIWE